MQKIGPHLGAGACSVGYVVVFEDADSGFAESFAEDACTNHHGCRVRFIRIATRDPTEGVEVVRRSRRPEEATNRMNSGFSRLSWNSHDFLELALFLGASEACRGTPA